MNLLALTVIGLTPTLLLVRPLEPERVLALAPTLGFALTALVATALVKSDLPVSTWWLGWLLIGLAIGAAVAYRQHWRFNGWTYATGLLAAAVLLVAPMLAGGLQYTVMRGNATDTLNYLTMASFLDRQPLSSAFNSTRQQLADLNLLFPLAGALLSERWASSALLAFTAHVGRVQLVRWDYGFSVLSMLLLYGVVFALGLELGLKRAAATLVALAITVGFWGQVIVDMRAIAQENGMCLVALIAYLGMRVSRASAAGWREFVALGLVFASLAVVYLELLPTAVLGLLLSMTVAARPGLARQWLGGAFAATALAALLSVASWSDLLRYAQAQASNAVFGQNNWHEAYFRWLYDDPWKGLWGLGSIAYDSAVAAWFGFDQGRWSQLLTFAGGALTVAFTVGAVLHLWRGRARCRWATPLGFVFASAVQALVLLQRDQLWAAGKAISFGYPFAMLILGATWLGGASNVLARGVALWFWIQVGLGVYRVWLTMQGAELPQYMTFHSSYRTHDWDLGSIQSALRRGGCQRLWTAVPDAWATEYLDLALADDCHVLDVYGARDRSGPPAPQTFDAPPSFILVDSAKWLDPAPDVVARNRDLALVNADAQRPIELDDTRPPQGAPAGYIRWRM